MLHKDLDTAHSILASRGVTVTAVRELNAYKAFLSAAGQHTRAHEVSRLSDGVAYAIETGMVNERSANYSQIQRQIRSLMARDCTTQRSTISNGVPMDGRGAKPKR